MREFVAADSGTSAPKMRFTVSAASSTPGAADSIGALTAGPVGVIRSSAQTRWTSSRPGVLQSLAEWSDNHTAGESLRRKESTMEWTYHLVRRTSVTDTSLCGGTNRSDPGVVQD